MNITFSEKTTGKKFSRSLQSIKILNKNMMCMSIYMVKERIIMEINAMMSAQLASLQQTLQMSILDKAMNTGAAGVVEMMEQLPAQQPTPAAHPYKGQVIDVQV